MHHSCFYHHLQGVWGHAAAPSGECEGQSPLASTKWSYRAHAASRGEDAPLRIAYDSAAQQYAAEHQG
jgi:hypothetical protein